MDDCSTSEVIEQSGKTEAALTAPTKPAGVAPSSSADSPRQHRNRIEAHALEEAPKEEAAPAPAAEEAPKEAHERVIAEAEAKHLPPPAVFVVEEFCAGGRLCRRSVLQEPIHVVDYFVREEFWADYESNQQRFKARAKEALAWLVGAVAAAYLSKKVQHAARQLLAVNIFTSNMSWIGIWDSLKAQVKSKLQDIGAPLSVHFVANGVGQQLGSIHTSITMHNACAAGNNARQGLPNVLPSPEWDYNDIEGLNERAYIHVLVLLALAIQPYYHKKVKDLIGNTHSPLISHLTPSPLRSSGGI
jgi:hypothetical protein